MRAAFLHVLSVVIGCLVAVAALEGASIAWLTLDEGRYTAAPLLFERSQNTYVRDMTRGTGCRFIDTLYPHPYVAFVHHANPPCGLDWVNDIGLFGPDMPVQRPADRYTVMLTGGSVASFLGGNQRPPWPNYLQEALQERYHSPTGKPWLVLDAAAGAWKEPQGFIIAALYAGSVDAFVNLSGYNEHFYFRPRFGQRLEAPASNFVSANPYVADENFGDAAIGWVIGRIAGSIQDNAVLNRSHAAYLALTAVQALATRHENFAGTVGNGKRTTIRSLFDLPRDIDGDPERQFDLQLSLYQKYWRATSALARDHGLPVSFFLQPVPAWGKTLTEDERRVTGNLSYAELYRRMVAGMLDLRERGLAVHDLGEVFAAQAGTIYADDIHYVSNTDGASPGNRLVAARIADLLAADWGLQPRAPRPLRQADGP